MDGIPLPAHDRATEGAAVPMSASEERHWLAALREEALVASPFSWLAAFAMLALTFHCGLHFLRWMQDWLFFPADLIMWGESGFISLIIKLREGVPLFLDPSESNSYVYPPGAAALSHAIVELVSLPTTIPVYRCVQLGFVGVAILVAWLDMSLLRPLMPPASRLDRLFWGGLALGLLSLAATAPRVNRYAWYLHTDGLALLFSMVAFAALVAYVSTPTRARLMTLALMPGLGFTIEPALLAWGPVNAVAIASLHWGSWRRVSSELILMTVVAASLFAAVFAAFYALWGSNFVFWVFGTMSGLSFGWGIYHDVSVLRMVGHAAEAWWELSIGVLAFGLSVRRHWDRRLVGLFLAWLLLVVFESCNSGSGWGVLYHYGPAVLIGVAWLCAVLPGTLPVFPRRGEDVPVASGRIFAFVVTLSVLLALRVLPGYGLERPLWEPGTEAHVEQVRAIENEFVGQDPEKILLDIGNWVYLESGTIVPDRAIPLGDQPRSGRYENFEPLLDRIRRQHYDKIIVRNHASDRFLYDSKSWDRPSGVKAALDAHYREVRVFPGFESKRILFDTPVSVFVPREPS